MAKAKSKSKKKSGAKKKASAKKTSVKKVNEEELDEVSVGVDADADAEAELTAGEKFLMASKPYWAHIALAVLSVIFASVLWSAWQGMSNESASAPWRELNNAMTQSGLTGDVSSLKEMAGENEGLAAANWALLMAGDNEVNRGIRMLVRDRVGGLKLIDKGVESLQKVVDAPAASKTPMLQRRSTFMMAYAKEALGKFGESKELYQSLLDAAPDSPFANVCRRGVSRCSNTDLAAVYDNFRNYEEGAEVAPGPLVPDAPKLNIDEFKLPEGEPDTFSGGDFGGEMKKEEAATETESKPVVETEVEKTQAEPAVEMKEPAVETPVETKVEEVEKAVEVKVDAPVETEVPVTEVPMTEVPATEVPATEVPVAEPPAIETPVTEVPATEPPVTEVPTPEVPAGEPPATEVPAVEVPAAEVPDAPATGGDG